MLSIRKFYVGIIFTIELHKALEQPLEAKHQPKSLLPIRRRERSRVGSKIQKPILEVNYDLKRIVARKTLGVYNTPKIEVTKIIVTKI